MLTLLALLAGAAPGPHATLSAPPRPLISGRAWNATLVVKPAPRTSPSIVARPPSGRSLVFRARRAGRGLAAANGRLWLYDAVAGLLVRLPAA